MKVILNFFVRVEISVVKRYRKHCSLKVLALIVIALFTDKNVIAHNFYHSTSTLEHTLKCVVYEYVFMNLIPLIEKFSPP